jgi:plastocyanin
MDQPTKPEVVVTDVRMPFGSMVVFMVKWALAAIPAFVMLFIIGVALAGVGMGLFRGVSSVGSSVGRHETSGVESAYSPPSLPAYASPSSAAPVTGKLVEVKMLGDENGYRFSPANITLEAGDGVKFVDVTGGPHNVAFDPVMVPEAARAQLSANMPTQMAELTGPLLVMPGEAYAISFGAMRPGTYEFHCTPHLAMGMKGTITVR